MTTPRPLTAKGRATRERIIAVAIEQFATVGYSAVSMRDLAAAAGVSSGAIYATFRGKADVLAEAVSASLAADLEMIDPSVEGMSLPEVVEHQFATLTQPGRARLRTLLLNAATAARVDTEVRERLEPMLRDRLSTWTSAYAEWASEVGVDPDLDTGTLVAVLVAIDIGLGALAELGVTTQGPGGIGARNVAPIVRSLLDGLTAP